MWHNFTSQKVNYFCPFLHAELLYWHWLIFWVRFLENYTLADGGYPTHDEIISNTENHVQNDQTLKPLSYQVLGSIVSDVWGDVVKDGKRDPRGPQRKGFINVVLKEKGVSTNDLIGFQFVEMANNVGLHLPVGWRKVMDSEQKVSFVHHENWTFNTCLWNFLRNLWPTIKWVMFWRAMVLLWAWIPLKLVKGFRICQ